jgi:hypothetical protein
VFHSFRFGRARCSSVTDFHQSHRSQTFKNDDLDGKFHRSQGKRVTDAEITLTNGEIRLVTDVTDGKPDAVL